MKVVAIDYGTSKIGFAVSDETGLIARGLEVLRVKNGSKLVNLVVKRLADLKPELVVVGVPYGWKGKDSPQTESVRDFISALEGEIGVSVETWDESYSTQRAERGAKGRRKKNSDSEAARIILQEFLDHRNES
ncbi:MAG: Holliday junction resolvase RuvX [Candidatus Dojkabacteria bacterium]